MSKAPFVLGKILGCAKDGEQVRADRHRPVNGDSRNLVQFAVRLVVGEDGVEVANAIECGAKRLVGRRFRGPHRR